MPATSVVLYASNPELMGATIDLLSSEWPRSEQSRRVTFEKCSKNPSELPQSAILLDQSGCVIGHSRICAVPGRSTYCWIESVVIRKDLRGRGLGRTLMSASESFAHNLGYQTAILSTHDQQQFYAKCGYTNCAPVCVMGAASSLLDSPQFNLFKQKMAGENQVEEFRSMPNGVNKPNVLAAPPPISANAPPPPPLPPPKLKSEINESEKIQFMKKSLV